MSNLAAILILTLGERVQWRGAFRTQSNIYNGDSFAKNLHCRRSTGFYSKKCSVILVVQNKYEMIKFVKNYKKLNSIKVNITVFQMLSLNLKPYLYLTLTKYLTFMKGLNGTESLRAKIRHKPKCLMFSFKGAWFW